MQRRGLPVCPSLLQALLTSHSQQSTSLCFSAQPLTNRNFRQGQLCNPESMTQTMARGLPAPECTCPLTTQGHLEPPESALTVISLCSPSLAMCLHPASHPSCGRLLPSPVHASSDFEGVTGGLREEAVQADPSAMVLFSFSKQSSLELKTILLLQPPASVLSFPVCFLQKAERSE